MLGNETLFEDYKGQRGPGGAAAPAEESLPPDIDTVYQIGSITKTFTSALFLRALQDGKVELNDPVSKYFSAARPPAFNPYNPYGDGEVTLHALASQTSGLPRAPLGGNIGVLGVTQDEIVQQLDGVRLTHAQLAASDYSNLGLGLLGYSVSRALATPGTNSTGQADTQRYQQAIVDQILVPLNMTRTGFQQFQTYRDETGGSVTIPANVALPATWVHGTTTATINANMAIGQTCGQDGAKIACKPSAFANTSFGWGNAFGGLSASARDMARYMQWLLSASRPAPEGVLSASSLHTFLEPAYAMRDGLSAYGFGTFENYYRDGYWVHTKGGLSSGVASFLAVAPDLGLGAFNAFNVDGSSCPTLVWQQFSAP